jgi:hypothetical protein
MQLGRTIALRQRDTALHTAHRGLTSSWPDDTLGQELGSAPDRGDGYRIALPHGSRCRANSAANCIAQCRYRVATVWPPLLELDAHSLTRLATCAGVVGVDSGLSHIAVALEPAPMCRSTTLIPPGAPVRCRGNTAWVSRRASAACLPARPPRWTRSGRPGPRWHRRHRQSAVDDTLALCAADVAGAAPAAAQTASARRTGARLPGTHRRAFWTLPHSCPAAGWYATGLDSRGFPG